MTNQFSEHQENPKNRRILCNQGKIYLSFSSQESSAIFSSLYLNTRIKVVNVKLNYLARYSQACDKHETYDGVMEWNFVW